MWVDKCAALAATRVEPIATAVPPPNASASAVCATHSLLGDCCLQARLAAERQSLEMPTASSGVKVQIRKG
jgi:hypothetical protein